MGTNATRILAALPSAGPEDVEQIEKTMGVRNPDLDAIPPGEFWREALVAFAAVRILRETGDLPTPPRSKRRYA